MKILSAVGAVFRASSAHAKKMLGWEAAASDSDTLMRTTGEAGRTRSHA